MNEEQKAKFHRFIVEKWGKGNSAGLPLCTMCKNPAMTWTFMEYIVTPISFATGSINLGGVVIPVIPVMCSNCGNTHFVNALTAGVITKAAPQNLEGQKNG